MRVDMSALYELVRQRYLSVQRHPAADLLIFNYTAKAQYERYWTAETSMCRGLIVTPEGVVVARPFPKFFNLEEHPADLPGTSFEVYEKLDGSLGILYWVADTPHIATRGSFIGEQAMYATRILRERYAGFPFERRYTYLFEIIYPANRIVVDYGALEELILLAVVDTASGAELDIHAREWPFPTARRLDAVTDLARLRALSSADGEGFVVRFANGVRVKVKFAEYVRLHRLVTGVNAKTIWELLRANQPFDDLLQRVPDEFYAWVTNTRDELRRQFAAIEAACLEVCRQVEHLPTRAEQAAVVTRGPHPSVVFMMLDGKDYRDAIWRLVRPPAADPFRQEV